MTWPGWLEPLPDAEAARAADRWAIDERGVPSLDLMERAAEGLAALVEHVAPQGLVVVCCGAGNNGGDGYAAARLLRESWREVRVLQVTDPASLRGDALVQAERLPGAPAEPFSAAGLEGAAVVVDAILGTGATGPPRAPVADALAAIAACGAPVVACDVPSGVDASTGEAAAGAVHAAATATFHAAKPGLWIAPGRRCSGQVEVVDIGIPVGAPGGAQVGLLQDGPLLAALPRRGPGDTKFSSGRVLVVGGAPGLLGAVILAASAAARAGAGYVSACVPAGQQPAAAAQLVEVMQLALPQDDAGGLSTDAAGPVLAELERRGGALVVGPGLGAGVGAQTLARELAARAPAPLVLDADGLNAHAGALDRLAARSAPTILTPHEGELGRLLGIPSAQVAARRLAHAREAAERSGAVVVLKGDDTLVAQPGGTVAVSPGAPAALATAGTGDVLAGVTGALLARGLDPFTAACAAVRIHALAAALATGRVGAEGLIARDVVDELSRARSGGARG